MKRKTIQMVAAACMAATMSLAALVGETVSLTTAGAEETSKLVTLDSYASYEIPSNNAHGAEYSINNDANKRLDYGIRKPGAGVLDGDPMTNPTDNLGNGVNVDYGVTKLRMAYGYGATRFRYGYGVDLSNTNINLNFLDLDGENGHLCLTFSNSYDAVSHPAINDNGVSLIIYQDSLTTWQTALLSAHNQGAVEGLETTNGNNTVCSYSVSADDPTSYCFSIYTYKNTEGRYCIEVVHKSGSYTYTLPASVSSELVREDGTTNIGMNAYPTQWQADPVNKYITYVIQVKDTYRTNYENSVLKPLLGQLENYSAAAIAEATVSSIADVDSWIAKRDAVDASLISSLRIGDRDYLQAYAKIAAANNALKEKAGTVVASYLDEQVAAMSTALADAISDTAYKTIAAEAVASLKETYEACANKVNGTYKDIATATEEQSAAWTNALAAAKKAVERSGVHAEIYQVEHMDLSTASAIVDAKAAYAQINNETFVAKIDALDTTEEVKTDLKGRVTAIESTIAAQEAKLDKAAIIENQVANYEAAAITTIEELRAALEKKALIDNYADLDGAEAIAARIQAKDAAIEDKAYEIVSVDSNALKALCDAGVAKYSQRTAIETAKGKISNTDLLSEEKLAEVNGIIDRATALVAEFDKALEDAHVAVASYNGGAPSTMDIELTENGVIYTNGGNQDAFLCTQKQDLSKGIEIKFSVKDMGYLNGGNTGKGSNNTYIWFSDRLMAGAGQYANRETGNALTVMFWNCVAQSYVKAYTTEFGNTEVNQGNITTFGDNDGSYVIVKLIANDAKKRFEITTSLYSADGEFIDACITPIAYTDNFTAELFENGVYVGFAAYMDERDTYTNVWDIEYVGETKYAAETSGGQTTPDNSASDNSQNTASSDSTQTATSSSDSNVTNTTTPATDTNSSSTSKGCFSVATSPILLAGMAAVAGLMAKKKKKRD
jgi:hypothetical protein